jgi:hypothetical protein
MQSLGFFLLTARIKAVSARQETPLVRRKRFRFKALSFPSKGPVCYQSSFNGLPLRKIVPFRFSIRLEAQKQIGLEDFPTSSKKPEITNRMKLTRSFPPKKRSMSCPPFLFLPSGKRPGRDFDYVDSDIPAKRNRV